MTGSLIEAGARYELPLATMLAATRLRIGNPTHARPKL